MAQPEGQHEIPPEYYIHLAQTAPRIPFDDERVVEYQQEQANASGQESGEPGHDQFGNNFYLLFQARRRKATKPNDVLVQVYLNRAEGLGTPWQTFEGENQELLMQIDDALEGKRPYDELMHRTADLMRKKAFDEADALNAAVGHPFGIEAVGMHAWDRLNPLLKTAAKQMTARGIDPKKFFG